MALPFAYTRTHERFFLYYHVFRPLSSLKPKVVSRNVESRVRRAAEKSFGQEMTE